MHYLEQSLAQNVEHVHVHSRLDKYDDTACSQKLLDVWHSGSLSQSDIALQFSIDGAQLQSGLQSEAWVFIWVVHNLPPPMWYKKDFIICGAIVPGPNKPEDLDSFLYPSLCHIAALQHEGLRIYDSSINTLIPCLIPCVLFGMADSLGSAAMSGMVGHIGKYGCHIYCVSRIALMCLKTQLCRCYKRAHTRSQKTEKPSKQKNRRKTTTLLAD